MPIFSRSSYQIHRLSPASEPYLFPKLIFNTNAAQEQIWEAASVLPLERTATSTSKPGASKNIIDNFFFLSVNYHVHGTLTLSVFLFLVKHQQLPETDAETREEEKEEKRRSHHGRCHQRHHGWRWLLKILFVLGPKKFRSI